MVPATKVERPVSVQTLCPWAVAGGPPKPEKPLRTDDMEVRVDPRAEWRQMYHETWRLQRDFLYDPHAHGLDLSAAEKKYAVFLDYGLMAREHAGWVKRWEQEIQPLLRG